jgi:uncharacterized phage protein (TIGR02218 family)
MADYLRTCSPALALALQGGVQLWSADIFKFALVDGVTVYTWAAWDSDLTVGSTVYSSRAPWLERSQWNVSNKMEVPSLKVTLAALNDSFEGGGNIKLQIHNGLFDGATFLLSRVFMDSPGNTVALGTIDLFGGSVSGIELTGLAADITIKGKVNLLDQNAPRNVFQIGCNHAFCDTGCTLNRAAYTTSYTVGTSPTTTFIPWTSAPSNPTRYINGTMALTGGAASGQRRNIANADSTGLTLAYPLYVLPSAGDAFTAFEGCDKTFNAAGSVQSCTARGNTQNYRGFEYVPPPNSAY